MFTELFFNAIVMGCLYSIYSLGFAIIFNTTRVFHFAHGGLYVLAGYLIYFLYINLGINLITTILLSLITMGLLGSFVEKFIYNIIRSKSASNAWTSLLMSSFGLFIMIPAIIEAIYGSGPKTFLSGELQQTFQVAQLNIVFTDIITIILFFMIYLFTVYMFDNTKFGAILKAISDNPRLALTKGIDVEKYYLIVFFIGTMYLVPPVILTGFSLGISPSMGLDVVMTAVVAVIIGGIGNLNGAVIGSFILSFAQNFTLFILDSQWQSVISYTILLLFLIARPQGILSSNTINKRGV